MKSVVICAYKRTGFGSFGGSLSKFSATDLAQSASTAAISSIPLDPSKIQATIFGNVCQSSPDAIYLARHVGLRVGVPIDKPALTVNRLCGSGFEAVVQGVYQILNEGASCVLVGGTESMTQTPYVLRNARFGYRLGHSEVEDFLHTSLTDAHVKMPMAMTAERVGEKYKISRADVDAYSLLSQQRHAAAVEKNLYQEEISPVEVKSSKGSTQFASDEHARPSTTLEALAGLKPLFKKEGLVTAGTASGISDGAAALILAEESWAKANSLPILAKILSWSAVGCLPEEMGMGPVGAILQATSRLESSWGIKSVSDYKLVEVNEAFAAQYIAVEKELKLSRDKTNIHGGAIALGHPLAASGARLTGHLALALKQQGGGIGVASACIGGGQGMAITLAV
jgi:acetyl-CoA acyltransferase 2